MNFNSSGFYFPSVSSIGLSSFTACFCFVEVLSPCTSLKSWNSSVRRSMLLFWCFIELFVRGLMVIIFYFNIFESRDFFPRSFVKNTPSSTLPCGCWKNSSWKPEPGGQVDTLHSGATFLSLVNAYQGSFPILSLQWWKEPFPNPTVWGGAKVGEKAPCSLCAI